MVVDIVTPKDRAKALGPYESMRFLGMIVGPGLGGVLAGAFTITVPFFVCGGLALATALLVVLTVRETITTINNIDSSRTQLNNSPEANPLSQHLLRPLYSSLHHGIF